MEPLPEQTQAEIDAIPVGLQMQCHCCDLVAQLDPDALWKMPPGWGFVDDLDYDNRLGPFYACPWHKDYD
jgi:hypothetical protein